MEGIWGVGDIIIESLVPLYNGVVSDFVMEWLVPLYNGVVSAVI